MSHTAPRPTHNRHAPKTQTTSPKTPQIHAFSPKWSAFWAIPCPAPVDWRGWKAPEGPEGLAAVPVGGGGTWPGIETTHRTRKQRPGTTGVEGAGGICRGAGGRWRDLAGHRDDAPNQKTATRPHWCGGRRRDLPRCRWAVVGHGRASRRRADQRPSPTGVEGAGGTGGPGCGARGRWRGLARHRDDAPNQKTATRHHWCGGPRRDRRARAGFEARRRTK